MKTFKIYLEDTAELDEGLKSKIAGAALAGMAALGGHAHAQDHSGFSHEYLHKAATMPGRHLISPDEARKEIERRKTAPAAQQHHEPAAQHGHSEGPGYSKDYLERVASGNHPRPMISQDKAKELLKQHHSQN